MTTPDPTAQPTRPAARPSPAATGGPAQPAPNPSLSVDIGQAERTLRALLDRVIGPAGVSFPEWTVFVSLDRQGPLTRSQLVARQVDGRAAPDAATAGAAVDRLVATGLVGPATAAGTGSAGSQGEPLLAATPDGEAVYQPLRQQVAELTQGIFGDLPPGDIEATRRTLAEVTRRGRARLAAAS